MKKKFSPPPVRPISRRRFLEASSLGLAGMAASSLMHSESPAASANAEQPGAGRPNIVLLIADDTGWNDVGYHHSEISTPNIDRMAEKGVVMDQFYACPTCSPTRAAILMGRPPSRYGILAPIAGRSTLSLPIGEPTLPSILGRAGYRTTQIGKWHLGLKPEVGPRKYGFDSSYGYFHGQIDQYTHIYKNGDRSWHRNEEFIDEKGHATDLIAAEAVRIISQGQGEKPFLLYVSFSVPHYPVQEEEQWVKPYEGKIANQSRRLYAASMTHMDDAIGRILEVLEEKSLSSGTLVIFVSDNGGQKDWTVGENEYDNRHGPYDRLGDNTPFRDWKGSVYEGGIRVPAVFYRPGELAPRRVTALSHVMDLLPTLAALGGAVIPAGKIVEGIDIRPALQGNPLSKERTLYWNTGSQLAVRRGDWKLIQNGPSLDQGTVELYDIAEDPYEKKDLAGERLTLTTQLREIMAGQRALDIIPE